MALAEDDVVEQLAAKGAAGPLEVWILPRTAVRRAHFLGTATVKERTGQKAEGTRQEAGERPELQATAFCLLLTAYRIDVGAEVTFQSSTLRRP